MLRHLEGFLPNHDLRVCAPGYVGSPIGVIEGVPQCSVLSALLFNISVAALPWCFPGNILRRRLGIAIYADDAVLWSVTNRQQAYPTRAVLQHGLNWTARCIEEQGLQVYASKTAMLECT